MLQAFVEYGFAAGIIVLIFCRAFRACIDGDLQPVILPILVYQRVFEQHPPVEYGVFMYPRNKLPGAQATVGAKQARAVLPLQNFVAHAAGILLVAVVAQLLAQTPVHVHQFIGVNIRGIHHFIHILKKFPDSAHRLPSP